MARRGENIYLRKDGRYEGRYIKYYDLYGKGVYGYVYSRSYTDVKNKLAECKGAKGNNLHVSDISFSDWLKTWVETLNDIKDTTRALYKRHIRNNINQAYITKLKYAPSTVRLIFSIIKSSLKAAEDNNLIQNRIWKKIKLPKKEKHSVNILTPAEQQCLECALKEKNDIGILICLYTGLRIGELCALKWSDIDFENGILCVNGTQTRLNGELKVISPKSRASVRKIPIPNFLLDKLKTVKREGLYVLNSHGDMVDLRSYRRRFKRLLKTTNLPDIKFHALRHTFASRALEVGMDYKTLSEILGHASVAITMDLYVHSLDEYKRIQMNKLNNLYLPSN